MADKDKEAKGKSGGAKKVILFLVCLLIVGAGVFAATYMFMQKSNQNTNVNANVNVNTNQVVQANTAELVYMDLGEVTVNLADEGGKRYFKGQISVGYDEKDKDAEKELKAKKVVVKDEIIFYLKSLKVDFINNPNNEKEIKTKLVEKINKQLTKSKVMDIRFDSILTQ